MTYYFPYCYYCGLPLSDNVKATHSVFCDNACYFNYKISGQRSKKGLVIGNGTYQNRIDRFYKNFAG